MTATTEARARAARRAGAPAEEAARPKAPEARKTATLNLPFVTAEFRMPKLHLPGRREVADAGRTVVGFLPPPSRLAYYGGLGMVAALGVIEWPVAVAIGAGTWIAQRGRREAAEEGAGEREEKPAEKAARATRK